MRILLTTAAVPFVRGGAEALAKGLRDALQRAGHEVDIMAVPFVREPLEDLYQNMEFWERFPVKGLWFKPDRVIPLKFPAYLMTGPCNAAWIMHEFREAYDLAPQCIAPSRCEEVRSRIRAADRSHLLSIPFRYTLSRTVAARISRATGIEMDPLYHPCPDADRLYQGNFDGYVFAPSRLEALKRQHLLIEAMQFVRTPVRAVVAGEGSLGKHFQGLIDRLGVADRVNLCGYVSAERKRELYANSLGVFFSPLDEDYGYITLEAMLAGKPVITAVDSGGPTEFVRDGESGFVLEPNPQRIAEVLDQLFTNRSLAMRMGEIARIHYRELNISWDNVVEALVC